MERNETDSAGPLLPKDEEDSAGLVVVDQLDIDELHDLEKGLKAPRWRERAQAAQHAASALVKDGHILRVSSEQVSSAGYIPVADVCDRPLQLLYQLASKDSYWQVRIAAVESATTILAASQEELPTDMFEKYVWGVLATCLDLQPEVQVAASKCILQHLMPASFRKRHVIVEKLCDRFVAAATGGDALPLNFAKVSARSEMTGLDSSPDGELLLAGITAGICLRLLPALTGWKSQGEQDLNRIPLLVVAASVALEDANRTKSRLIAEGLSKLLRCLGVPYYGESLMAMFNSTAPVYLSGWGLARMYQNAGIVDEGTANVIKTVKTETLLKGISLAFEPSHHGEQWRNILLSDSQCAPCQSKVSGFSQGELIALQQIVKMLEVPAELTKTLNDEDKESKMIEFIQSAMPLLSISTSIIKSRYCRPGNVPLPSKLAEDLVLCLAAFAGGHGEYELVTPWTLKELQELSWALLICLSDNSNAIGGLTLPRNASQDSTSLRISSFISRKLHSLLPRLKQVIQGSSGIDDSKGLHDPSPDGSVASSVIAAYQMQWLLRQLEHPDLDPHCQLLMPCVLTALDHFSPEVKRQAMGTIIHLAQNMNPSELQLYKDVILDAVARSLVGYGDLWPVAVKMAITTVTCLEGRNPRGSWYGRIFNDMIGELERQRDEQGRRIVWLQEIAPLMEAMGLLLVAHFKRLLPLLFYWLHVPDDATCIMTLTILQTVITHTWPRIPAHVRRIWTELLHTYQDSKSRKLKSDIQTAVVAVCTHLYLCAGPSFEAVWQEGDDNDLVSVLRTMHPGTKVEC